MAEVQLNMDTEQRLVLWNAESITTALNQVVRGNVNVTSVVIDTRRMEPGAMFIGLPGEHIDGGQFVAEAFSKGAELCIIKDAQQVVPQYSERCVVVPNPVEALYQLARYSRTRIEGKVIGVTGSVGKTSTKEMLRLVLGTQGQTYANYGTYNNHYGVPLSLANVEPQVDYAVLEMGMNHAGELRALSSLAKPHVAVVTTVAPAHLEFFSSVSAIAAAKAEIFEGLVQGGYAIVDYDNLYHQILIRAAESCGAEVIGFGRDPKSQFRLLETRVEGTRTIVQVECSGRVHEYVLPVLGEHWAKISVAVIAAVWSVGADINAAMHQMQYFVPPSGRGIVREVAKRKIKVIDDAYNANPASIAASLAVLGQHKKLAGRVIAILGDMRELGPKAPQLHAELAQVVGQHGIDTVHTVGELMYHLHQALPEHNRGVHCTNAKEMAQIISTYIQPDDVILIKGSNSIKMSLVVQELLA